MSGLNLEPSMMESYILTFYGHGSYEARYWFVGMEFGGGGSADEIESRIQGWHKRGGKELEDLGPHGVGAGSRWFRSPFPLQPTWAKLIRIVLSAEGRVPSNDDIRAYQKNELGRRGGRDCILELLPLPSPGLNRWRFYPEYAADHPELGYLGNRETYTSKVAPFRVEHLKERIGRHQPQAVIFYGTGYRHWWRSIAGVEFKMFGTEKVWVARNKHTLYIIMQHPTARGLRKSYFDGVGQLIAGASPA